MVVPEGGRGHAELRKKPRRQFHYNAKIVIGRKGPPLACAISDISESGARLGLEKDVELPARHPLLGR